ncbi:ferrous iron transport protein A [Flavimobilis sp. GY10621]|uniref:Ferrous iron transport protein A n=1 Tax=Flavimobilis rhizosphaerae TaxID=2775421 RepID=A0ABR9DRM1_9MICO|nr:FeoA family protein [Flavimobilis rhizosphaerae]MBD9699751.1 ferrous iron transport protein A [Flavimobilis rhizosphaerae]
MTLALLPVGLDAVVAHVNVDGPLGARLAELGLRPGAHVRTTHTAAAGARVVALGADRIALDQATCGRVQISLP